MNNLILVSSFLMSALDPSVTVYAQTEPIPIPLTIQEQGEQIALEYDISWKNFDELIQCESSWNEKADNGYDRGLLQINRKYHAGISDEQAFDPVWSMRWGANEIKEGRSSQWVCANCYQYATMRLGRLPRMSEIQSNTSHPVVGGLVIIWFNGVKHLMVVEKVVEGGIIVSDANFGTYTIRRNVLVTWDYLEDKEAEYFRLPESVVSE